MDTMVEIYEVEPQIITELTEEELENVSRQIEKLGLHGQKYLYGGRYSADGSTTPDTNERVPYMHMNQGTKAIIQTLCPAAVYAHEFKHEVIPPRVLNEIERAKKWFPNEKQLVIRYAGDKPDPFLIANIEPTGFRYDTELPYAGNEGYFVIARWGEEAASWEELRERAVKLEMIRQKADLERRIRDARHSLEGLEADVHQMFYGRP